MYWQNAGLASRMTEITWGESSSVGRASAFQAEGRRFEPGLSLQKSIPFIIPLVAGWSSQVARRAHNPKVEGSNPSPATKLSVTYSYVTYL